MARSRPLLTEAQWQKIAPFAQAHASSSVDRNPPRVGTDFVDFAEWRLLAGLAGDVSAPLDLLAATKRLTGAGRLAEHLASGFERTERAPANEMERHAFRQTLVERARGVVQTLDRQGHDHMFGEHEGSVQ